jgi:hypothetical protein
MLNDEFEIKERANFKVDSHEKIKVKVNKNFQFEQKDQDSLEMKFNNLSCSTHQEDEDSPHQEDEDSTLQDDQDPPY